jgi:hypothetical protein
MLVGLLVLTLLAQPRLPRGAPRGPQPTQPLPTSTSLTVRTAAGEARATVLPGQPSPDPRPLAETKAGVKPQIRWAVRNLDPKRAVRNLVVHFLVTREERAGEPIPASPRQGSLLDSVLGTDLSARQGTTGNYNTAIYEPGVYLVEVELLDPQGNRRQYCAIDLKVDRP